MNVVSVLIFTGDAPPRLIKAWLYRGKPVYQHYNREMSKLALQIVFATYFDGNSGAILVASDRSVRLDEILNAHHNLITQHNNKDKNRDHNQLRRV